MMVIMDKARLMVVIQNFKLATLHPLEVIGILYLRRIHFYSYKTLLFVAYLHFILLVSCIRRYFWPFLHNYIVLRLNRF